MKDQKHRGQVRPGRPAILPRERLRNRVMVSFTDAEYDLLEKAAKGGAMAALIRETALRVLKRRIIRAGKR